MNTTPLPADKKLQVLFRVEAGCLGPDGDNHVQAFCRFAQATISASGSGFYHCSVSPRDDKTLPEIQYQIGAKNLSRDQATKFLSLFETDLSNFEDNLENQIAALIGEYHAQLP